MKYRGEIGQIENNLRDLVSFIYTQWAKIPAETDKKQAFVYISVSNFFCGPKGPFIINDTQ